MEEMQSNVGLKTLTILMDRNYSSDTIDNLVGVVVFSKDKKAMKTQLLSFLEENPNATEDELLQLLEELIDKYVDY